MCQIQNSATVSVCVWVGVAVGIEDYQAGMK